MEIPQVGEIWFRINPMHGNPIYYPPRGWKVEILRADTLNIIYQVVEYDGEVRIGTTRSSLETEDFLAMYEKVK